jgi:hypothetical protein
MSLPWCNSPQGLIVGSSLCSKVVSHWHHLPLHMARPLVSSQNLRHCGRRTGWIMSSLLSYQTILVPVLKPLWLVRFLPLVKRFQLYPWIWLKSLANLGLFRFLQQWKGKAGWSITGSGWHSAHHNPFFKHWTLMQQVRDRFTPAALIMYVL